MTGPRASSAIHDVQPEPSTLPKSLLALAAREAQDAGEADSDQADTDHGNADQADTDHPERGNADAGAADHDLPELPEAASDQSLFASDD